MNGTMDRYFKDKDRDAIRCEISVQRLYSRGYW